jgi:hypothetical protein
MKRFLSAVCIGVLAAVGAQAQNTDYVYRVSFINKTGTTGTLTNPSAYLSPKALQRRTRFNIAIDSTDLPVSQVYIDSVLNRTSGYYRVQSKWLNQFVFYAKSPSLVDTLRTLPFVADARLVATYIDGIPKTSRASKFAAEEQLEGLQSPEEILAAQDISATNGSASPVTYGTAFSQLAMTNANYLHDSNYLGQGITIAVLDAGFNNVNNLPHFDSLRNDGRLLGTWNFMSDTDYVYSTSISGHGTNVLGCMAADYPGVYIGTAPKASYYLFMTEDAYTEQQVEEDYWVAAAERADSVGVDMINSSLGYTDFDDNFSYSFATLDGKTSVCARGANVVVKKGIFMTNSAGNEGDNNWHYLITPADADDVFTIGAVDGSKVGADFSSWGPNATGAQKPNVSALGKQAILVSPGGGIGKGNGTSFASPIMCGMVACFWQAFPQYTNLEIAKLVEESADHYANPDYKIGYGVPDFKKAMDKQQALSIYNRTKEEFNMFAYPNPFNNSISVMITKPVNGNIDFRLLDICGRELYRTSIYSKSDLFFNINFSHLGLQRGTYLLQVVYKDAASSVLQIQKM